MCNGNTQQIGLGLGCFEDFTDPGPLAPQAKGLTTPPPMLNITKLMDILRLAKIHLYENQLSVVTFFSSFHTGMSTRFPDKSAAYRKCHSQFTDTADYRRPGRNTWQDESGVYSNTHYKQQVLKPTNPIPESVS